MTKSKWLVNWLSRQYTTKEELINWTYNAPFWQHNFSGGTMIRVKSWFEPSIEDFIGMRLNLHSQFNNHGQQNQKLTT